MSSFAIQKNLSLFIPRVSSTLTAEQIGHFFEYYDFGKVMRVDLFPCKRPFNRATLYFEYWNQNEMVENFQEKIIKGKEPRVMYDEPNYWNLYMNRRNVYENENNKKNVKTNEKGALLLASIGRIKTNEKGALLLASIGRIKTNMNGAKILSAVCGKTNSDPRSIRYIYRKLEEGEILE